MQGCFLPFKFLYAGNTGVTLLFLFSSFLVIWRFLTSHWRTVSSA